MIEFDYFKSIPGKSSQIVEDFSDYIHPFLVHLEKMSAEFLTGGEEFEGSGFIPEAISSTGSKEGFCIGAKGWLWPKTNTVAGKHFVSMVEELTALPHKTFSDWFCDKYLLTPVKIKDSRGETIIRGLAGLAEDCIIARVPKHTNSVSTNGLFSIYNNPDFEKITLEEYTNLYQKGN